MNPHIVRHLSKYLVALSLIIMGTFSVSLVGCKLTEENATPEQLVELREAKAREAAAKEAEAAAKAAGNAELEAAAAAAKKEAEEDLTALEVRVMRERGGLVIGMLAAIHPSLVPFAPLVGTLTPLLGPRGRRKAWDVLQNLQPWGNLEPGEKPHVAPIAAIKSLIEFTGATSSTPPPKPAPTS